MPRPAVATATLTRDLADALTKNHIEDVTGRPNDVVARALVNFLDYFVEAPETPGGSE